MATTLRRLPRTLPRIPAPRFHSSTAATTSTSTPRPTPETARVYCQSLLSTHDHASALLSTFHPASTRDAHLALRAFNLEIALIDSQTFNQTLGKLRIQFWRETFNSLFNPPVHAPPAEPIATLLHKVLWDDEVPWSKSFFLKLLATREKFLGGKAFETMDELESYAEGTYGSLHYLALEAAGAQDALLDHIGSHIGKASGIVAVLRGIPAGVRQGPGGTGTVVLPISVLAEKGVRQEEVLRQGPGAKGLKDAVFEVATRANDHLITARKMLDEAGEKAKNGAVFASYLQAVPAQLFLERLEKADFDPFAPQLLRREWKLPWRAYRSFSKRSF